jgi:hypothetical protein
MSAAVAFREIGAGGNSECARLTRGRMAGWARLGRGSGWWGIPATATATVGVFCGFHDN